MTIVLAAVLHIAAWRGANLPTASPVAIKYKLTVEGKPHETVALHADGVPHGWVASFCTPQFCAPFHVDATLDDNGHALYEFALIRIGKHAPPRVHVTISAPGATSVRI